MENMENYDVTQINSRLNDTELSDENFQMLVIIFEIADGVKRATSDGSLGSLRRRCDSIAETIKLFMEGRGILFAYDEETETYHYGTEHGGN
jgi:hypothetical protein